MEKNRFDYSSTLYKGYLIKVTIKCNKCGHIFKQTPKQHLKGVGCIKCRNLNRISILQTFIKKAEKST
jgi:phage FluMu protein Com